MQVSKSFSQSADSSLHVMSSKLGGEKHAPSAGASSQLGRQDPSLPTSGEKTQYPAAAHASQSSLKSSQGMPGSSLSGMPTSGSSLSGTPGSSLSGTPGRVLSGTPSSGRVSAPPPSISPSLRPAEERRRSYVVLASSCAADATTEAADAKRRK